MKNKRTKEWKVKTRRKTSLAPLSHSFTLSLFHLFFIVGLFVLPPSPTYADDPVPVRWRTYVRGFGNLTSIDDDLQTTSYGFSGGAERQIDRTLLAGLGFGAVSASMKGDERKEINHLFGYHLSTYARKIVRRLYFDGEIGIGHNQFKRPQFRDSALQWNVNAETGTWWESGIAKFEPYLGLRYTGLDDTEYRNGKTDGKTQSILGLRYSWKSVGPLSVTKPLCYLGWIHEWGSRDLIGVASFVDAPNVYAAKGYQVPQDRFYFGGGFTSSMGKSLDLYLRYTAEMASDYSAHTLLIGMNWNY